MGGWIARHIDQLFDDMGRRRQIRVAHAKVDNILPARPRCRPHRIDFCNDIGRQAFDAVKFFGHGGTFWLGRGQETWAYSLLHALARESLNGNRKQTTIGIGAG